jgi:transcriptional regulator with XRE-family HTH domain
MMYWSETMKRKPTNTPAERMRQARTGINMSQAELALRLGVSKQMVCKWEGSGVDRLHDPKLSTIHHIADALSVSPAWLAFGAPFADRI